MRNHKFLYLGLSALFFNINVHASGLLCQSINTLPQAYVLPNTVSQVILVKSTQGVQAEITLCQRTHNDWQNILPSPIKGVLGKQGVAPMNQKKEGDHKTPAGAYPIGEAFGIEPIALHMDYRFITEDDKYIDDPNHSRYNSWITGTTDAKSFETMKIPAYKWGAVINYNINPVVKGAGSAIFFHIWKSNTAGTEGCIATDEHSVKKVLKWLNKAKHPYIVIL